MIHARRQPPNSGSPTRQHHLPDTQDTHFESEEHVQKRSKRFYETFWNHPSKMSGISTSAPESTEDFEEDPDDVVPAASPSSARRTSTLHAEVSSSADDDENHGCSRKTRDDDEGDDAASSCSGGSDDEDEDNANHRHDPETLRKLEVLRTMHEYVNAQDRCECVRLTTEPTVTPYMQTVAVKIAKQVAKGCEDACTDTIAAHCLEAAVRCFSFYTPSRQRADSPQNIVADALMHHIIEERIYNATRSAGKPQSLLPYKRIDANFALLGELLKYNMRALLRFQQYLDGSIAVQSLPTKYPPIAGQESPSEHGAHPPGNHPVAADSKPMRLARGQREPMLSVLRYRLRQFGVDTNLFIRCLVLSLTPNITSPFNYVWKPLTATADDVLSEPEGRAIASSLTEALVLLPTAERVSETAALQMERIYYVREVSRRAIEAHCSMDVNQRKRYRVDDASYNADVEWKERVALLDTIMRAPQTRPLDQRPIPNVVNDEERELLRRGAPLPRAGLPSAVFDALMQRCVMESFVSGNAAQQRPVFNARDMNFDQLRFLERSLLSNPAELLYQMLSGLNAEAIENTERLCVVTSSVLVLLRCSALGGHAAVEEVLRDLKTLVSRRLASRQRRQRHVDSNRERSHPPCSVATPLSEQCDNFAVFGACRPYSVVDVYYVQHAKYFFRNFFRLVCIWLAHYSCSQRYVETLFYCTHVPFGEWKIIMLYVWRRALELAEEE